MNSPILDKKRAAIRDTAVFGMLGALMFASKILMAVLPNIHLLALFIGVLTRVYRRRALIPIYLYVLLDGLFSGFSLWWFPYLYIFLPLFFAFLLIPRRLPRAVAAVLYPTLAGLHGLAFGILYAPAQALLFGLCTPQAILTWIAAGFPFDLIHGISNAAFGVLIFPLSELLKRLSGAPHGHSEGSS